MEIAAYVALNRFGLGRRPEEALPANPHAWLRAQLAGPDTTPSAGLPDTAAGLAVVAQEFAMKAQAKLAAMAPAAPEGGAKAAPAAGGDNHLVGELGKREQQALMARAMTTDTPFRERLVWFWANHFSIAARSLVTAACGGAYIREAIRPHVTGRFADMLMAVMRHPAMIEYLNQGRSAGPDSLAGQRRHLGLNENLARECLELHTVTPASGYTQADVTSFARVLTGWSLETRQSPLGFRFRPVLHEPGEIEVMGRTWPAGEAGGMALLEWLGTHPATFRHLAQKLACHFVADTPPPDEVAHIEAVLRDTGGNLGAASAALIDLPGAWVPQAKLRTPQEFVLACLRAGSLSAEAVPNAAGMAGGLGQPLFQAPFPIGWPDRAADWAGPEAMLQRVDYAYGLSARLGNFDPEQLGHTVLGPLMSTGTLDQIKAAGSRRDGLTLLLASPDFQRR